MNSRLQKPIYLVQPEVSKIGHLSLPFSIMFVGKALSKAGYRVKLFHLYPGQESTIFQAIQNETPLFVGVSASIGFTLKWLIMISKTIHKLGIPLVWGGPFSSMVPELVLKAHYINYVVVGEAEKNVVPLAKAIASQDKPKGIPGVGYKDGEEIHIEPPARLEMNIDLFEPGWELVPIEQYFSRFYKREEWSIQFLFSRGCPFQCSFCYNRVDPQRQNWRVHSTEYIKSQIDYLNIHLPKPPDALGFVGDNTFGDPKRARAIISEIGKAWGGVLRIENLDEDFVQWAKETRAIYLGFGLETASEKMQRLYRRNNTKEQFLKGMELLNKTDALIDMGVLFFGPEETIEDRRETVEFMNKLYFLNKRIFFAVNPFWAQPKTPLWEKCLNMGFKPPETIEEWSENYLDFMKVHNFTHRKWARVHTTNHLLYGICFEDNPLKKGWMREFLYKRYLNFSFTLPVEEILRLKQKFSRLRLY